MSGATVVPSGVVAARSSTSRGEALVRASRRLHRNLAALRFSEPVRHVYDPLFYARAPHEEYLRRFGGAGGRVLLLGMNPGPFGMVQTGVPFGEVSLVRDWLGIAGRVGRPASEHPKRPVLGFDCPRSEVSGARLWGWARERFGSPERFFADFFVANWCPLAFVAEGGRNVTPDQLGPAERQALGDVCGASLKEIVELLETRKVVGVGGFAEKKAREIFGDRIPIGSILHPSPASPAANRGWSGQAEAQLRALGIRLPD